MNGILCYSTWGGLRKRNMRDDFPVILIRLHYTHCFYPLFFTTKPGRNGVENCQNMDGIGISTVQAHNPDISRLYPQVAIAPALAPDDSLQHDIPNNQPQRQFQ
jgi:hypothetical protein